MEILGPFKGMYRGVVLGVCWHNGKENGNYCLRYGV